MLQSVTGPGFPGMGMTSGQDAQEVAASAPITTIMVNGESSVDDNSKTVVIIIATTLRIWMVVIEVVVEVGASIKTGDIDDEILAIVFS